MTSTLLPHYEIRSVKHYYLITILANCWFSTATWIFFVQKYMSLTTFGLVDSAIFALGLLLEIPTGALADLLGKKRAIQLAMLFLSFGSLAMGLSQDKFWLIISMALVQVGLAFYSGSVEAFVYDSLLDANESKNYDRVIATGIALINITCAVTTALGGWLYEWNFRSPLLAWSIGNFLGLILSLFITEPLHDSLQVTWGNYWEKTRLGVRSLFNSKLLPTLPLIWLLLGVVFLWDWGMVRTVSATFFKLPITAQASIYAILPLLAVVVVRWLPWFRRQVSDLTGLQIIGLILVVAHSAFAWISGWWGISVLAVIAVGGSLVQPLSSLLVNQVVESRYRATALSTLALITKIPYILFSPIIGYLADQGKYQWYGIGVAVVLTLVIIQSQIAKRVKVY